ncbi:hypothetical protein N0B40_05295 [Chryseobacterium oranimense]|uniref:hypothetical protein n=1 Tax=Chryseobacterium oranimense TaxID=421058 RepID=UPI0021AF73EE|nr:hypothetical protein [Chryseobacterium oranimense]UWX61696.1 hypothetical protein N0B40_05295 [Chryseobacterium oranimense]
MVVICQLVPAGTVKSSAIKKLAEAELDVPPNPRLVLDSVVFPVLFCSSDHGILWVRQYRF